MTEEKRKFCPFSLSAEGIKKSGCYCIEERCMAWVPEKTIQVRVTNNYGMGIEEYISRGGEFRDKTIPARCKLIPKEPKQDLYTKQISMNDKPNPGSDEAIKQGCTCPRLDNHCGKSCYDDGELFWINQNCPLHGTGTAG